MSETKYHTENQTPTEKYKAYKTLSWDLLLLALEMCV